MDIIILFPPIVFTVIGYYLIVTKQYLKYDIQIGYFIFWITATAQGLIDFVNIYFTPTSTLNEIIAGAASFLLIVITSLVLIYQILRTSDSLKLLWEKSSSSDKNALYIYLIFLSIFFIVEYGTSLGNTQVSEIIMASIAIGLDLIALIIIKSDIYKNIDQQRKTPWILWSISLLYFCILEAVFNYRGKDFPSIGWIMLIENFLVITIVLYFIVDAKNTEKRALSSI